MVIVEWTDHQFHQGEWDPVEAGSGFALQVSVGYLVENTEERIVVAQSITYAREDIPIFKFGEAIVIDKRTLKSIKFLRK